MPAPDEKASCFEAILARELREIRKRRALCPEELEEMRKQRAHLAAELRKIRKQRGKRRAHAAQVAGPPSETTRPEELFPKRNPIPQPSAARPAPVVPAQPGAQAPAAPAEPQESFHSSIYKANHSNLVGLAFSGGGIRSATFNLGVLQALAQRKLLHRFDYLSTISGGGYIGAWLSAWIYRRGMREVETRLGAERKDQPHFKDPPEIGFLREYSNYLTPRKGFLGADTWTAIAIYCRNLLLNQLVLILFIAGILLIPRALTTFVECPPHWLGIHPWIPAIAALVAIAIVALTVERANMRGYTINPKPDRVLARVTVKATNETKVRVVLLPGDTELQFKELRDSHPRVEIWDPSITRRKDVSRGCEVSGFNPIPATGANANAWEMNLTIPVSADPGDLVIAVYAGITKTRRIVSWVALPVFAAGTILACLIAQYGRHVDLSFWKNLSSPLWWAVAGAAIYMGLWLSVFVVGRDLDKPEDGRLRKYLSVGFSALSPVIAGATGGLLLWKVTPLLQHWACSPPKMWDVLGFGAPIVTLILLASTVLQIGLLGVVFSEPRREWWGRLAAILLITCFVWAGAFAMAGYAPLLLLRLWSFPASRWLAAIAWLASTGVGILGGKSAQSGSSDSHTWKDIVLGVTPYIFIVGLLMLVSLGIHTTLMRTTNQTVSPSPKETTAIKISGSGERSAEPSGDTTIKLTITQQQTTSVPSAPYWCSVQKSLDPYIYYALGICLGTAFLLALRFDLNEFSMHYLYRNRLVRCYLGASNRERVPNPFTGFDVNDDIHLAKLTTQNSYGGPLPIFGAALNLVHGKDLAWQERKAESFVMTPLFCGFDVWFERFARPGQWDKRGLDEYGYRRTQNFAYPEGFYVGTAMAISGAAASPNMGYHSSPALSFLMTVFNVRLGWWVGNPRHCQSWRNAGPLVGLGYLLAELFGGTDDSGKYVYLSDGGHFENLGIYELVKRRCRFILASDAGADKDLKFGDLASAIRKCRSDMGIEIKMKTDTLSASGTPPFSKWHCAVGEIQYEGSDPGAKNGILVYIKASLTSDEPADVLNYKSRYPDFPHQSTADQWFTESQFEGYRALGKHVIETVLQGLKDLSGDPDKVSLDQLFEKLKTFWENAEEIQALRWPPNTGP